MFEGFIRNGHSGELALDDIRLGTDIPLDSCMGTCCIPPRGQGGRGLPRLESLGLQAVSEPPLPWLNFQEFLGLSSPMKEMRAIQPLGDRGSACVGVRRRKHMSLPRRAERAADGY